jgi:hypothetical protein
VVLDLEADQRSQRPRVCGVLVAVELEAPGAGGDDAQHTGDLALDRTRVGTPERALQLGAAAALARGHAATAAELGVGEAVDIVREPPDHEQVLGGVVLAVLEGAQAVQGQRLGELALGAQALVEEQAVAAEAVRLAHDRLRRAGELAGELAVAGAVGQGVDREGSAHEAPPVPTAARLPADYLQPLVRALADPSNARCGAA